jgi:hypothetical protein
MSLTLFDQNREILILHLPAQVMKIKIYKAYGRLAIVFPGGGSGSRRAGA